MISKLWLSGKQEKLCIQWTNEIISKREGRQGRGVTDQSIFRLQQSANYVSPNNTNSHEMDIYCINKPEEGNNEYMHDAFNIYWWIWCIAVFKRRYKKNWKAMEVLLNTCKRRRARYEIDLLWKYNYRKLPESREVQRKS